jgi:hypothetical protein
MNAQRTGGGPVISKPTALARPENLSEPETAVVNVPQDDGTFLVSRSPHESGVREIPLTRGLVALVDEDDFEMLSQWKWSANCDGGYACRGFRSAFGHHARSYMHRTIMLPDPGQQIDHINGDKLDNRRANLRICTNSQNGRNRPAPTTNTSGFKGVSWNKKRGLWLAKIHDGEYRWLGCFALKEDAAQAYDEAARDHFGKFAYLNFPEGTS